MHKYSYIIVDDTEFRRLTSCEFLKNCTFLILKKQFSKVSEAKAYLNKSKVDVIFIDIDQPDRSGIEFVKSLHNNYVCVFITSHPEFAIAGFDLAAIDCVIKPIDPERFDICLKKLKDYLDLSYKSKLFDFSYGESMIHIKEGTSNHKVDVKEIMYLEAQKDYTRIVTPDKKFTVRGTIGNLLETADFRKFIRIHKSYALQPIFVDSIKSDSVILNDLHILPVGRKFKENLAQLI